MQHDVQSKDKNIRTKYEKIRTKYEKIRTKYERIKHHVYSMRSTDRYRIEAFI